MATNPTPSPVASQAPRERSSRGIVTGAASNELVFAVVGHVGSGTSEVATALATILAENEFEGKRFDVKMLRAREVIREWATERGETVPTETAQPRLADVRVLQDLGDKMRSEKNTEGEVDYAAVARGLVEKIREARAAATHAVIEEGKAVAPDGSPRAYILDSLRHPEEVQLLRRIYGDAFVLVGVVCEQERRCARVQKKYADAGRSSALEFMDRDASATEPNGQHVGDTFHLSDFFVDNTAERLVNNQPNDAWDINDHLSRVVKILTHAELVRPTTAETAMYHAAAAAMQSACLSRQVGAALVDREGNVVATGTNEAPRAGGGVYGEGSGTYDYRCAFMKGENANYCRNTRTQNEIIHELMESVPELKTLATARKEQLAIELRNSPIGSLIEFSRAVHAEMDAVLSAARKGVSPLGTSLFVTTFPCHYCARHIVGAGLDEVQYIEPYPKSRALQLHDDAIAIEKTDWKAPSKGGQRVLFRPFSGVAPRFYERAFVKDRTLKNAITGNMELGSPKWGQPWHLGQTSYIELEAALTKRNSENG